MTKIAAPTDKTATPPALRIAMLVCAAVLVVFHLALIFSGLVPNLVSRPLHLALALPWLFFFTDRTGLSRYSGFVIGAVGIACTVRVAVNHDMLLDQYGFIETPMQTAIGFALLAVVLEGARRSIGWPITVTSPKPATRAGASRPVNDQDLAGPIRLRCVRATPHRASYPSAPRGSFLDADRGARLPAD